MNNSEYSFPKAWVDKYFYLGPEGIILEWLRTWKAREKDPEVK
jgi:hypothetical protein